MRREPGLKLERSPLVLVLAQVRFSPVLKMEAHVSDIQEALRQRSFARYSQEQTQQILFGPEVRTDVATRWVFATRDRREAIVLANDFIVYETTRYDVFETFVDRLRMALEILREKVGIAFAQQLGLRYVDLIRGMDGKEPHELVQATIRGFRSEDLGAEQCSHQFTMRAATPRGELTIRSVENSGGAILPPDLAETRLALDVQPCGDEVFRILDIDHISKTDRDFEPEALIGAMWELHEFSSKAFKAAVTAEAMEIWRKVARGQ